MDIYLKWLLSWIKVVLNYWQCLIQNYLSLRVYRLKSLIKKLRYNILTNINQCELYLTEIKNKSNYQCGF